MEYPTIPIQDARAILGSIRAGEDAAAPDPVVRGGGERFDPDRIDELFMELMALRRDIGEPGSDRRYWARYEGKGAAIVHRVLGIDATIATDPGFWAWLAFGRDDYNFIRLVDWRFQKPLGGAKEVNYGLGGTLNSLAEGLFSRMWFRGDVAWDPHTEDPYELAYRGDQDIWRSHVFRQEYGSARGVAKALIRFQYPDGAPEEKTVDNVTIRAVAKELRRRHATIAFELLSREEAKQLVEDVHGSIRAP